MTFQRARSAEQREERRRTILDTALKMLDEMPVSEVSLNELSRRVGLAKSNVLRYFESREAVLLELLDRALRDWLAEVADEVTAGVAPDRPARERAEAFAAVVSRSLARRTVLCDLIGAQAGVLEHNVSTDVVVRFKRSALGGLEAMAELLRRAVPEAGGEAAQVCLLAMILAGGLWTHCRPSASARAAYEADPALTALRLDLAPALEHGLALLITGAMARNG
ncbi:TetR family transcriptional regulator [Amycolatopsis mediterranei S699]|uniref:TetR family transcriptional regulator n=2 Tax=Amycolatopsis mediterranei TaxID=33910 RepID=A0A0H3D5Z8_AMYMU|nr:TetR family transcriptional regulator [Amycolatopsis mediterranei]ADJ45727.1 TetR family transcriptional regulator [Amycolatopsis mediterranei U32]AEK42509.1 TetR family transcriptional regulator [Amycolatopsis mediterranei S699]AFO77438.1 TetR family transcriptional regulator [Amycolatopsis mediterranei S699]AGT84566.1 TetR family transcriptional regulator [Amycolatopsis mediterranei RB]KDO05774.1 TetR family transcriptional regulator [Amycolatopsis mediterranei]